MLYCYCKIIPSVKTQVWTLCARAYVIETETNYNLQHISLVLCCSGNSCSHLLVILCLSILQTQLKVYLKPLKDWALLPAHIPKASQYDRISNFHNKTDLEAAEHYLIPLGKADTIIDFTHTSIMTSGIKDCLRKLGPLAVIFPDWSEQRFGSQKKIFFDESLVYTHRQHHQFRHRHLWYF